MHDLAAFACRALGKEFEDPSPEVSRQWAVFEGMIALMTPQGFADLMDTMWPEMLDAMPMGMGGMMPKVMDNLMPKMLPDMVPLIVPKMITFLRSRPPVQNTL